MRPFSARCNSTKAASLAGSLEGAAAVRTTYSDGGQHAFWAAPSSTRAAMRPFSARCNSTKAASLAGSLEGAKT
ncbi:hypothetical protein MZTS_22470 [Methylorubrum zatmanii]|nr:hypothetical protein [Methylorubrum zatmanii]